MQIFQKSSGNGGGEGGESRIKNWPGLKPFGQLKISERIKIPEKILEYQETFRDKFWEKNSQEKILRKIPGREKFQEEKNSGKRKIPRRQKFWEGDNSGKIKILGREKIQEEKKSGKRKIPEGKIPKNIPEKYQCHMVLFGVVSSQCCNNGNFN